MSRNLLLFIFILLFSPIFSQAAVLYLNPSSGEYYEGDTFIVNILVDTEEECINVIYADLSFPKDILEARDFSIGNSIISVWLKEPELSNEKGAISFSGGIPGGYCGRIIGDPGQSNLLGRIIFKVKEMGGNPTSAQIEFLDSSRVLLNDGLGTKAKLSVEKAVFTVFPQRAEVLKREWQRELEEDKISPESFIIEVNKDSNLFGGKYFLIFQAQDKQTGIDHFEVKEADFAAWVEAKSPYLLKNQRLKFAIQVKAVDKAGNSRIVEYSPITEKAKFPWIFVLTAITGIFIIYYYVRKNISRNH